MDRMYWDWLGHLTRLSMTFSERNRQGRRWQSKTSLGDVMIRKGIPKQARAEIRAELEDLNIWVKDGQAQVARSLDLVAALQLLHEEVIASAFENTAGRLTWGTLTLPYR